MCPPGWTKNVKNKLGQEHRMLKGDNSEGRCPREGYVLGSKSTQPRNNDVIRGERFSLQCHTCATGYDFPPLTFCIVRGKE